MTIELRGKFKYLLKKSDIIRLSPGITPLIAETTVFSEISSLSFPRVSFKNAAGTTNKRISDSLAI
jgi:hypothetical protein